MSAQIENNPLNSSFRKVTDIQIDNSGSGYDWNETEIELSRVFLC